MKRIAILSLVVCGTVAQVGGVSAQTVELYDGAASKGLFASSPAGFKYLDFAPSGVIDDTGSSFIVNATEDSDGSMGLFGILGRNVPDAPVAVDANTHQLRVVYRFLEGNEAQMFKVVLTDQDDAGAGEQYKFDVTTDADATETDDGFMELFMPISEDDADHRTPGTEAGFSKDGDGVANYDLTQWQVQSVYGSTGALNVEIRQIEIVSNEP